MDPERFVQHFAENRDRLFAFILSMVPARVDAEDIFQQTSLVLWREFHTFRPDGDFLRWANGISFNQIRNFRRKRQRDRHAFSDELLEQLAEDEGCMSLELSDRWEALSRCLNRLRPSDRKIVEMYYGSDNTAQDVAERVNRSIFAIRKAIQRLRRALFDCVDARLKQVSS